MERGTLGAELLDLQCAAFRLFVTRPESNLFTEFQLFSAIGGDARATAAFINRLLDCRILIEAGVTSSREEPQFSLLHRTILNSSRLNMAWHVNDDGWDGATISIPKRREPVPLPMLIDKKSWLPAWSQTIVFLAGCLGAEAVPMIEALNSGRRDTVWHRPVLALQCLAELRPRDRNQSQANSLSKQMFEFIQRIRYTSDITPKAIMPGYAECCRALAHVNGVIEGAKARPFATGENGVNENGVIEGRQRFREWLARTVNEWVDTIPVIAPFISATDDIVTALKEFVLNEKYSGNGPEYGDTVGALLAGDADVITVCGALFWNEVQFL